MTFEFATSARIVFGAGSLQSIAAIAGEHGQRALVVTGRSMARAEPLLNKLKDRLVVEVFSISGEPTIEVVRTGVAACRRLGAELVVAIGGGSVLDAGKAVAGLATQEGSPLDYLEVIGRGLPLDRATLPFIAIPTTAGTGAEVTRNAVLT
ncbi:MAG: iron-containing alcohol dehydrogenase, partial [Vicinamibacteria bacterium]|nr:iron-containing alcohol dehydrogenase [Vicinamibacteria bacterium]